MLNIFKESKRRQKSGNDIKKRRKIRPRKTDNTMVD